MSGVKQVNKKKCRVAAGIFVDAKRVLMGRRLSSENRFAGYWEFPGGKIESGESEQQALKREIKEELGLEVVSSSVFEQIVWDYPDRQIELNFFLCELSEVEISKMNLEVHSELAWFGIDELKKLQVLPANESIIEKLVRTLT